MISLHEVDKKTLQILGSQDGVIVSGIAFKVHVTGNTKRVWQYILRLSKHPKQMTIRCNEKEGTITNQEILMDRIERGIKEFQAEFKEA